LRITIIKPDLGRIDTINILIFFNIVGRTENNINAALVSFPAGFTCSPSKILIGIIQPAIVFLSELIARRLRSGIALFPEGLNKNISFAVGLEL